MLVIAEPNAKKLLADVPVIRSLAFKKMYVANCWGTSVAAIWYSVFKKDGVGAFFLFETRSSLLSRIAGHQLS